MLILAGDRFRLFNLAGVAGQVATDQLAIAERTQCCTDDRRAQRHQEIRDIFAAGEGYVSPACQPGERFRPDITRRVHRKPGQRAHWGPNNGDQQANQQRRQRPARNAVTIVGQRQNHAHQDSGNHHFYRECLHKIDMRVWISRENTRQLKTFDAAAHHIVRVFEVDEKIVVKPVDQRGGAERPGKLRNDERDDLAAIKAGKQPQRDGDCRVKMCAGNPGGQIDGHRHPQTPDDADFPLAEARTRDFQRRNTPHAEKYQQPGTKKLCDALAF